MCSVLIEFDWTMVFAVAETFAFGYVRDVWVM